MATPHFWERFLQIADSCLFLWKLPRCEPKCPQQWSDIQPQALRICKKRTQKVLMFATLILLNICFSFISVTYTWSLFKPLHSVYVKWYWLIGFGFVDRRSMKFVFRTPIFLYVFMNTWRHSRIKLRIFKWKGVYVRRYWFSIFVVVDRCLLYFKTSR